ncbi:EAL domain-containing protein [Klebsiella pneumoniae]|nr:EAL domain-containing protein [Klebsiella pneumoniae]MEA4748380.1 EAL domain-containing protein [Klebsiella pneumoniae]HBW8009194.1 EAL domain-containing protein [Klebsiella pneumoniae]
MKAWQYFFISLSLFIAMTLLAFAYIVPVWHELMSGHQSDELLEDRVNFLLRDARELSVYFRHQGDLQCSPDRARQLEHEALRYPHIHGLYLYHNGEIYCSSLRERFIPDDAFVAATRDAEDGRLLLLSGLKAFPGKVFLAYVRGNKDHGMAVTIDAYWLRHWFSADGLNAVIVDGKLLNRNLTVTSAEGIHTKVTHSVKSPLSGVSVVSFRHDNRFQLFWPVVAMLAVALGMLIALLVCLYRERAFPTPRRLEVAILSGEIVPWYQPIMDVSRGEIRGVEVLARWHHPGKGTLGPGTFIPLAERSGLLVPMTLTLLDQVRRDMEVLKFRLPANFHVSVNINATPEMVDALADTLVSFHRSFPGRLSLVVELTEGTEVRSDSPVIALLRDLRLEGIGIALDDFGTAFSNIAGIDQLPVTCLKIDQGFIRKLADSMDSQRLVESIIELGRNNQLSVVAEGVETAFQSDFLMSRGVSLQQGYYWSRPLPMMDFARYLIWHRKITGAFIEMGEKRQ